MSATRDAEGTGASPTLLEIRGASKSFPGVQALDDVSLELRQGEVLALVGENGAGKSTLMKLLSGIDQPDAGEFLLDGERITPASPKHAQALGIAIIHQELNLMPDLPSRRTSSSGASLGGVASSCPIAHSTAAPASCSTGSGWRSIPRSWSAT